MTNKNQIVTERRCKLGELRKEDLEIQNVEISIAGRMTLTRVMGRPASPLCRA